MEYKIIDLDQLTESRELMTDRLPFYIFIFILLILLLLLITLAWMWWGEIEIVVRTTGLVRPQENISLIYSPDSGYLKEVNYYSGKLVNKGGLLYKIDTGLLTDKKKLINNKKEKLITEIKNLHLFEESITVQETLFAGNESSYYLQFLQFINEYERLTIEYQNIKIDYLREKSLAPQATTTARLQKLKSNLKVAGINRDNYQRKILLGIKNEIQGKKQGLIYLQQQLTEIDYQLTRAIVRAPINGEIQVIQQFNRGDFLPAGTEVLRIIPETENKFQMELTVSNQDISKIREGQQVKYRLQALPYREYGIIKGKIKQIAGDASLVTVNQDNLPFVVKATVDDVQLQNNQGEPVFLKSGMLSEARIIVGRQKILDYVLEILDFR